MHNISENCEKCETTKEQAIDVRDHLKSSCLLWMTILLNLFLNCIRTLACIEPEVKGFHLICSCTLAAYSVTVYSYGNMYDISENVKHLTYVRINPLKK